MTYQESLAARLEIMKPVIIHTGPPHLNVLSRECIAGLRCYAMSPDVPGSNSRNVCRSALRHADVTVYNGVMASRCAVLCCAVLCCALQSIPFRRPSLKQIEECLAAEAPQLTPGIADLVRSACTTHARGRGGRRTLANAWCAAAHCKL